MKIVCPPSLCPGKRDQCALSASWAARAALFLLLIALSATCRAQTAQISGRVTDATGAVLPQAAITVTNTDTQISRQTVTNQSGNFNLPLLPPGNYKLIAGKEGFSSITEQHIVLDVDQSLSLDVALPTGTVEQTVEVQSSAELLEATTSDLGTVINERAVHELPLNGRNFTQLLTLTPGATPISVSQGGNVGTDDGSAVSLPGSSYSNPSINGQQNRSTLFLFDGVVNTDFRTSVYTVLPIIDAIDEFKIVSHNDDPAYGSVLGGVVNLVSKSGTNRLHGSAWEFLRNDFFDARNSFNDVARTSPQPFRQNEFGGTVGGPVRIPKLYNGRDKTFFFFAYEGWRYRQPTGNHYYSPTAAELNGDFSHSILVAGNGSSNAGQPRAIYDPNSTVQTSPGTFTRTQFSYNGVANVIDPSRINTQIQNYLKAYLDKPNIPDTGNGNTVNNATLVNNANDYHGRVDERLTDHDTLFFRWSTMGVNLTSPSSNTIANGSIFHGLNFGGGFTHVFSPKLIFDVRGGRATRPFTFDIVSTNGDAALAGFNTLGTFGPPGVHFGSFYNDAGLGGAALRRNSSGSMSSSLTYQAGNHNLTAGGGFIKQYRSQSGNNQSYTFNQLQTGLPVAGSATTIEDGTGNQLASALLGIPSSGQFNAHNVIRYSYVSWFGFVADSWKVSPRLTVNYGLRFDHLDQPNLEAGINNGFNFATGNYELGGGKLPGACITTQVSPCIPGPSADVNADLAAVPGFDGSVAGSHIVVTSNPLRGPQPEWKNYGPRLGFAYKATNDTVVRGGFGVVFDDLSGVSQTFSNSINSWPSAGTSNPQFNATFDAPQTTVAQSQGNIAGGLPSPTPFNQGGFFYDPKMKIAYSEQYNLGVDTTIAPHYLLSASYVGAVSRRLDYGGQANGNRIPNVEASRPFPYSVWIAWDQSTASSNYNALQVKFERQMTRGFQFLLAYTWSKSIDDSSGRFGLAEAGPGGGSAVQNFYDPRSNRSVSAYDIPHFLSVASLYELPFGKGKPYLNSGLASYVAGGWQLSNLAQIRSGQPYTLQVDPDIAGIGFSGYGRPNLVPGVNAKPDHSTRTMWFNPAAFSLPVLSYGNVGRDSMRSANVVNDDFSVFKNFAFKEDIFLQFRAEAFNVFNIINYAAPNSDISSGQAGVVGSQELPSRQLQFALKLNF